MICSSSSLSGISALAVALLFFKLKVLSELACSSHHFVYSAAGERRVENDLRYFRNSVNDKHCIGKMFSHLAIYVNLHCHKDIYLYDGV